MPKIIHGDGEFVALWLKQHGMAKYYISDCIQHADGTATVVLRRRGPLRILIGLLW